MMKDKYIHTPKNGFLPSTLLIGKFKISCVHNVSIHMIEFFSVHNYTIKLVKSAPLYMRNTQTLKYYIGSPFLARCLKGY